MSQFTRIQSLSMPVIPGAFAVRSCLLSAFVKILTINQLRLIFSITFHCFSAIMPRPVFIAELWVVLQKLESIFQFIFWTFRSFHCLLSRFPQFSSEAQSFGHSHPQLPVWYFRQSWLSSFHLESASNCCLQSMERLTKQIYSLRQCFSKSRCTLLSSLDSSQSYHNCVWYRWVIFEIASIEFKGLLSWFFGLILKPVFRFWFCKWQSWAKWYRCLSYFRFPKDTWVLSECCRGHFWKIIHFPCWYPFQRFPSCTEWIRETFWRWRKTV